MSDRRPILVLDDDAEVLRLIGTVLERDGHEVLLTTSPLDALELVRSRSPSVLLVDLMLPQMDGEAFLAAIRRDPPPRPARVIIVSASALRDDLGARDDVDAVLAKPFELDELRALVARLAAT